MNREDIIICIGIVVLFYHFQDNTSHVEQIDQVKEPTTQGSVNIIKEKQKQAPNEVYGITTDSSGNKEIKDNQPKQNYQVKVITVPVLS